jgi:Zn-dependent protease with chaperone function
MIGALALLGYAACAAWCAPVLLGRLCGRGLSVRAGLAAWLIAMASVLAAAALALESSLTTAAADWPRLTQTLCRSIAGEACTTAVYESVFYQAGVAALAFALSAGAAVAAWRYGRRVRRSRRQTRAHAEAARIVGRDLAQDIAAAAQPGTATGPGTTTQLGTGTRPGTAIGPGTATRTGTVVLDDPRPAAYCVAGRPAAIVITSGALALLDPPQLRAVLAHERAHLAHGHAALATVTRGLAAAFPGVPLFATGRAEVERLTEMSADDTAARTAGRPTLAAALLAIATGVRYPGTSQPATRPGGEPETAPGQPNPHAPAAARGANQAIPLGGLAAAAYAVPARVERMLRPPRPVAALAVAAALTALSVLLALTPAVLALLIG